MTFDTLEESLEDGEPIYLYRFALNEKVWRYTSADADITAAGALWVAVPIADSGVSLTGETSSDALTIQTVTKIMPAQIYMKYPPSRPMSVSILRTHDSDLDNTKAIYVGEVSQHNVPIPGQSVFTLETLTAAMQREGLRMAWQRDCTHVLYDTLTCRANKAGKGVAAVISSLLDGELVATALAAFPDNYFAGGFVEWNDTNRGIEARSIESNIGGTLNMFGNTDGLTVGQAITAYPGCMHNTDACITTFNNLLNYGGIPDFAGESPFDGNPVFI